MFYHLLKVKTSKWWDQHLKMARLSPNLIFFTKPQLHCLLNDSPQGKEGESRTPGELWSIALSSSPQSCYFAGSCYLSKIPTNIALYFMIYIFLF